MGRLYLHETILSFSAQFSPDTGRSPVKARAGRTPLDRRLEGRLSALGLFTATVIFEIGVDKAVDLSVHDRLNVAVLISGAGILRKCIRHENV